MSGVDNRIVTMQFNNRSFEQNARTSLTTLQKLKESMNFGSIVGGTVRALGTIEGALSKIGLRTPFSPMIRTANAGLERVGGVLDRLGMKNPFATGVQGASDLQRAAQAAGGPAGMGVLEGGVTAVSGKFIALSTIAITTLTNITNKAISSTTAWLKSFTVAPIMDGLHEYETTLKSIQTVQANTDQPLPKIEKALKDLNDYSDTTIYNFGEMAKNVGTFTAAGVNLEDSVASIRGIANVAALSGSSSEQAAGAMYQLSQAIAAGKVGAQDWNSVVNAGMAGKKLQNALAQTAVAMGVLNKSAVTTNKSTGALQINAESFKNSIMAKPGQESWLSSGVLVNTLASLDGRFSVAYQKAQLTESGVRKFTDAQIKANMAEARANLEKKNGVKFSDQQYKELLKMASAATKSAQDVKTLGQVFDIAKETIGSGWSASFKNIFGNLKQSKKLFTEMSNGLNEIIRNNSIARNELLSAWSGSKFGGRATLITGLKSAWEALLGILGPIKEGFRDIFPAKTVRQLQIMTFRFAMFTNSLKPSEETMKNIRDIAGGVFAVFGIGKQIISGIIAGFKALFDAVGGGNGDFLDFAANVGRSIKEFNDFLQRTGIITAFFEGLGRILAVPIGFIKQIGEGLGNIFGGFDLGKVEALGGAMGKVTDEFKGLSAVGDGVRSTFEAIANFLGNIGSLIGTALAGIGGLIADALTSEAFGPALDAVNTGLLAGITAMLVKWFNGGVKVDFTGGLFDGITETLNSATGALTDLQTNLKANVLLKIGIAIAVLAGALLVLSSIKPAAMRNALVAMTAGFGLLIAAMATMMKVLGPVGIIQIYAVSSAMTKLAAAILLLAFALKIMSNIKFGAMLRGLVGVAALMYILNKALVPMAAGSKGMMRAAGALILVGVALNILAIALKIFATMSWEEMGRGLAGLTGTLLALVVGLKAMPDLNAEAITLVALGIAINLLAIALKVFATMSWEEMGKGLTMLAASLGIISGALRSMPKGILLQAVALNAVAAAMVVLSGALKVMASMGWKEIGRGLATMAGAMLILAVGLRAMGGKALVGAVAMVVVAGALSVLVPILITLGNLKISTIVTGLAALAGIFVVLGLAGFVLGPLTPVIIGLSAAMLLLGAGLSLAGAGALLAATAFGIVVAAGIAGAQVLSHILTTIIAAIPAAMSAFAKGVVQFAVAIGEGAPRIAAAFGRVLSNLIDQVIRNTPKLGRMFLVMLHTALRVITTSIPAITNAGLKLIVGFLGAISRHLPRIINLAADIIVKFLNGIARNLGRIIQSGVNLILAFVRGVAQAIRNNDRELGEAGADLGIAMVSGMANAIRGAAGRIKDAAMEAARKAWEAVKDFFKIKSPSRLMRDTVGKPIVDGWVKGIHDEAPSVANEITAVGKTAVSKLNEAMSGINDALSLDPNFDPTITPVLDLAQLTKEANKMSSILATAPIMPTVSYLAASDISAATQASAEDDGPDGPGSGGGDQYNELNLHLHSPRPIDSVESYRAGKSLISLAKEALK